MKVYMEKPSKKMKKNLPIKRRKKKKDFEVTRKRKKNKRVRRDVIQSEADLEQRYIEFNDGSDGSWYIMENEKQELSKERGKKAHCFTYSEKWNLILIDQ